MPLLTNIGWLATCPPGVPQRDAGVVRDAVLAWDDGRVRWAGGAGSCPREYRDGGTVDAGGRLVVPGLVDCHTHLAFDGWRADEFTARLEGASYLEIAARGGGILRTVRATRAATAEILLARCLSRLDEARRVGVTTVECKSGYGLDEQSELKLLGVYRDAAARQPSRIVPTLLAAHAVPPEYRDRRAAYVELVASAILPRVAREGLARFCDVFVEEGAFTVEEARTIFRAAAAHGVRAKLHADQLSDGGGAALAAEVGAASADHLEHVSASGVAALAGAGVVAVSLPLAAACLGSAPMPARRLIDAAVPVAVATDFNPGTAPSGHLPYVMTLACLLQRMTPSEALTGATVHAARALGLEGTVGSLTPGAAADFAIIDADGVDDWLYRFRPNACVATWIGGRCVAERSG